MIRRLLNFLPWRRAVNRDLEDLFRRCRNGSETRLEIVKEMSGFKKALGDAIGDLRELREALKRIRKLEVDMMNAKHENEVLRVALVEASKALLPPRVTTDRSSDPL